MIVEKRTKYDECLYFIDLEPRANDGDEFLSSLFNTERNAIWKSRPAPAQKCRRRRGDGNKMRVAVEDDWWDIDGRGHNAIGKSRPAPAQKGRRRRGDGNKMCVAVEDDWWDIDGCHGCGGVKEVKG